MCTPLSIPNSFLFFVWKLQIHPLLMVMLGHARAQAQVADVLRAKNETKLLWFLFIKKKKVALVFYYYYGLWNTYIQIHCRSIPLKLKILY